MYHLWAIFRLQHQLPDAPAVTNVLCQDRIDVGCIGAAIPDPFRIDDHRGPQLASVETARCVDPHIVEPHLLGPGFHVTPEFHAALPGTAAPGMSFGPFVGAKENVAAVIGRRVLDE